MAYMYLTRTNGAGLGLSRFVARFVGAVVGWNDARRTRKSLSKLTDRELDDIGLVRGDIDAIAERSMR
jgi:uncharacterized protein YjiS (DUF1127 family)